MVFIVKPRLEPSFDGSLHGKVNEVAMRVRLDADTTNDFLFCGTRLIHQKEVMLKKWEVRVQKFIGGKTESSWESTR
jgi:hypothetical protein